MSKVVDERVVSMRFDNSNFEKNVSASMGTLDKLKQSLNLDGAAKGLDAVGKAAKQCDISALGASAETVSMKFSAMQVAWATAISNITNSAVNAGKKIVSALTIDPVSTGFSEYETQINAIQTILANTSSKGTTLDEVNEALDTLNEYADKTIYNFTEMTKNIGTFTAAGIGLDTSVSAIQGIANVAAISGANSTKAANAMYQLSQALASGTVKLQDWMSIETSDMGGEVFQNALKETARVHGIAVDEMIEENGSFRYSLQEGWLTADIMTETLQKFTKTGVAEYLSELTGVEQDQIEATQELVDKNESGTESYDELAKTLAATGKISQDEAAELLEMADTAENAATKVKTFSQLWDTLKEAAQSGWTQTWEIIVGDFEEAKKLLTSLSDFFSGIINGMSEARNAVLESALGSHFSDLVDKINDVSDSVETVTSAVKDYSGIVDQIIAGDWGNGSERVDKLTKAGYDWAQAQNLVNEALGDSTRHATDYTEAQEEVVEVQEKTIAELGEMSDAQLRSAGYTEEQIEAIEELKTQADKLGLSFEDFVNNVDELDGRTLILNSLKNIGQSLVDIFNSIGIAWKEAFYGTTDSETIISKQADALYNLIAAFHKLSQNLIINDTALDQIKRTFKGVFSVIKAVGVVIKTILSPLTNVFGLAKTGGGTALKVTAKIGDALSAVSEWIVGSHGIVAWIETLYDRIGNLLSQADSLPIISQAFGKINEVLHGVADAIQSGFEAFDSWTKQADPLILICDKLAEVCSAVASAIGQIVNKVQSIPQVQSFISNLKMDFSSLYETGKNAVQGLYNGISDGSLNVVQLLCDIGTRMVESIKSVLGIHSPSTVMYSVGTNTTEGLKNGLSDGLENITGVLETIASTIASAFQSINWDTVFAGSMSGSLVAMVAIFYKVAKSLNGSMAALIVVLKDFGSVAKSVSSSVSTVATSVGGVLKSFSEVVSSVALVIKKSAKAVSKVVKAFAKVVKGFAKILNAEAFSIRAKAIKNLATSLTMIVACIAILALLPRENVEFAVTVFASLVLVFGVLVKAIEGMGTIGDISKGVDFVMIAKAFKQIATCITLLAIAIKIVGSMNLGQAAQGFGMLAGLLVVIAGVMFIYGTFVKGKAAQNTDKFGTLMTKLGVSLILMAVVVKLLGSMDEATLKQGYKAMVAFMAIVAIMSLLVSKTGKVSQNLGSTLLKISAALIIMAVAVKLLGSMDAGTLAQGYAALIAFMAIVFILTKIVSGGKDAAKVGGTILAVSAAMILLAVVVKMLGGMDIASLAKGIVAVALFALIIKSLCTSVSSLGGQVAKVGGTLLLISVAIGILAVVCAALGLLSVETLAKGLVAVGFLSLFMTMLIKATGSASKSMPSVIALAALVAVLAVALIALATIPDPAKLAVASASLSVLMGAMAILAKMSSSSKTGLATIAVLAAVVVVLAVVLYALKDLPVESTLAVATSLSTLLVSMSAAALLLSKIGTVSAAAMGGAAQMLLLVTALSALLIGVGALANAVDLDVEGIAEKLGGIGYALGNFVGSIIGGLGAGVAFGLPAIGESLKTFCESIASVPAGVADNAESIATALLALTASSLVDGIASFFGGGIGNFVGSISKFLEGMKTVCETLNGEGYEVKDENVKTVTKLGKLFSAISDAAPKQGVIQLLAGKSDLQVFGESADAFVQSMKGVCTTLASEEFAVDGKKTKLVTKLGKLFNKVNKYAPQQGVLNILAGKSDLQAFGESADAFVGSMKGVCTTLASEEFAVDDTKSQLVEDLGKLFNKVNEYAPEDGTIEKLTGATDLTSFGVSAAAFVSCMKNVCTNLKDDAFNDLSETQTQKVSDLAELFAAVYAAAPKDESSWDKFWGTTDIASFGDSAESFIKSMATTATALTKNDVNVDEGKLSAITTAGTSIANMATTIKDTDFSGLDSIKIDLSGFGTAISDFGAAMENLNAIDISPLTNVFTSLSSIAADSSATSAIQSVIFTITSSISDLQSNVKTSGESITTNLATGMTNKLTCVADAATQIITTGTNKVTDSKNVLVNSGTKIIGFIVTGISDKKPSVLAAVTTILAAAALTIQLKESEFRSAGKNLGRGLVNGINDKKQDVYDAARELGEQAVKGEKKGQESNSPSKATYRAGIYLGQGLINGMTSITGSVYKSGKDLGTTVATGVSKAIDLANNLLDDEIDSTPTISPVVDLSNVQNGVSAINELFGSNQLIGVKAMARSIGGGISNNKTGMNNLISAVDDLRKNLSDNNRAINLTVNLDYKADADATTIANDIAVALRRAVRRGAVT